MARRAAPETVSSSELADYLDLTPGWIRKLHQLGLPRDASGRYPLRECVRWYIGTLRGAEGIEGTLEEWRRRKTAAEARTKEHELAALERKSIPTDEVRDMLEQIHVPFGLAIEPLGRKLAGKLVGLSEPEIQTAIDRETRHALEDLTTTAIACRRAVEPEDVPGDHSP